MQIQAPELLQRPPINFVAQRQTCFCRKIFVELIATARPLPAARMPGDAHPIRQRGRGDVWQAKE